MPIKIFNQDKVNEGSDAEYACTFIGADAAETILVPAAVSAITATLKNVADDVVINSRSSQNVLNANGGALALDGTFTLQLGTLDNAIVGTPVNGVEQHRLTLHVTYTKVGGGTGILNHEVRLFIQALEDIT